MQKQTKSTPWTFCQWRDDNIVFTIAHIHVEWSFPIMTFNFQAWSMQSGTDKLLVWIASSCEPWNMQSGIDIPLVPSINSPLFVVLNRKHCELWKRVFTRLRYCHKNHWCHLYISDSQASIKWIMWGVFCCWLIPLATQFYHQHSTINLHRSSTQHNWHTNGLTQHTQHHQIFTVPGLYKHKGHT